MIVGKALAAPNRSVLAARHSSRNPLEKPEGESSNDASLKESLQVWVAADDSPEISHNLPRPSLIELVLPGTVETPGKAQEVARTRLLDWRKHRSA